MQKLLLENEIEEKRRLIRSWRITDADLLLQLKARLSWIDFNLVNCRVHTINFNFCKQFKVKHNRKLFSLGLTVNYGKLLPDKVIYNLSSKILSSEHKEGLSLGLKFHFAPLKIDYYRYFSSFKVLLKKLTTRTISNDTPDSFILFKSKLKNIALKYYYSSKPNI